MPKSKKRTRVQFGLQKKKTTKKKTRREKRRTQKKRTQKRRKVLHGGIKLESDVSIYGKFSNNNKREVAIRDFEVESKTVKGIEDIAFELTVDPKAVSIFRVTGSDSKQYLRIYCETRDEPDLILSNLSNPTFTPYEDAPDQAPYSNDSRPI